MCTLSRSKTVKQKKITFNYLMLMNHVFVLSLSFQCFIDPPIIVSTKRVPSYEDIQYPTYKQILKDILRDTFALNNDEIKGSYGYKYDFLLTLFSSYQFISQKIMNQIACILGQLYDNTTFSLDINELNALLSIDYKAKDFESAIQKPSLLASNTISESMIDLNYLFYKVFHLLSRSYSGEILYKALGMLSLHNPIH